MLRRLARLRRVDPEDLRLTIQAHLQAGYNRPRAIRAALRTLGRHNEPKRKRPLEHDPIDTIDEEEETDDTAHRNGAKILKAFAKRFPNAYERWTDNPNDKQALKTATLAATQIAEQLDEPYRTAAKRIALSRTVTKRKGH